MQQGTLRQFILNANAIANLQVANFSIGGGGCQSIALASALPVITDTVTLDAAATQEGFTGTPLIELNGSGVATLNDGVRISASGVTVRGIHHQPVPRRRDPPRRQQQRHRRQLDRPRRHRHGRARQRQPGRPRPRREQRHRRHRAERPERDLRQRGGGIRIDGAGATGNLVQGNFIGTDRTGTLDLGNAGDGISIQGSADRQHDRRVRPRRRATSSPGTTTTASRSPAAAAAT